MKNGKKKMAIKESELELLMREYEFHQKIIRERKRKICRYKYKKVLEKWIRIK